MRIEAIVWTLVAVYFAVVGVLYLLFSAEPAGVTFLLFASAYGGLVTGWLWHWNRTNPERAEDVSTADARDEIGVVGVYPSASVRPLGIALGMTATALGFAVGLWLTVVGVAMLASQVALMVRDADR